MSWWDKYFAPGDLRSRQQLQNQSQPSPSTGAKDGSQPEIIVVKPLQPRISAADRVRRQNALLYGGIAFTALSLFVTRRALQRKHAQVQAQNIARAVTPGTVVSSSSTQTPPAAASKVDGSLEAVQALGYATLNVFSFAVLSIGAAMTYFDFADLEDLREGVRRQAGYAEDSESEREIEAWVAEVLARKDGKGELRAGVAERVAEIERLRKVEEEGRRKS